MTQALNLKASFGDANIEKIYEASSLIKTIEIKKQGFKIVF